MSVVDAIPLHALPASASERRPLRTLRSNGRPAAPATLALSSPRTSFEDPEFLDSARDSLLPKPTPLSASGTVPRRQPSIGTSTPLPLATSSISEGAAAPIWLPPFVADNSGLLLVALSQLFFAFMNITVKYFLSVSHISTLTLIAVRMWITGFLCILYLWWVGDPNPWLGPPPLRMLLSMRGFFGFAGLFSNYQSYLGLSVSDSITIQFLAPCGTALLGYLWLGERMSWKEVAGGGCALIGVLLVSRPPFLFGGNGGEAGDSIMESGSAGRVFGSVVETAGREDSGRISRMAGVGWALVCVVTASTAYITIRAIGTRAHALHSMAYFAYFCVISSTIVLIVSPEPFIFVETWKDFGLIILIGIFGFIAQMLLTLGLQREKAGRASMAMYLGLFYTLILELIIFHTIPPFLSFLGAGVIIASAIWVAMHKDPPPPTPIGMAEDEESRGGSGPPTPTSSRSPMLPRANIPSDLRYTRDAAPSAGVDDGASEDGDGIGDIPDKSPLHSGGPLLRQTSTDSRASDGLRVDRQGLGRRRSINALRADD